VFTGPSKPDVWLKPHLVFEISADCFTLSSTYKLGNNIKLDPTKEGHGISLRFPIFKRERQDKRAKDTS
jgi:ATP-dependent DNA ligase